MTLYVYTVVKSLCEFIWFMTANLFSHFPQRFSTAYWRTTRYKSCSIDITELSARLTALKKLINSGYTQYLLNVTSAQVSAILWHILAAVQVTWPGCMLHWLISPVLCFTNWYHYLNSVFCVFCHVYPIMPYSIFLWFMPQFPRICLWLLI